MMVRKIFLAYHLPVVLYSGLIFWGSSIPSLPTNLPFTIKDKLLHFLEYLILGILLIRSGLVLNREKNAVVILGVVFLVGIIYAATDELHQGFVPGRDMNFWDWLADSIGVAAGSGIGYIISDKLRKR